MGASVIVACTVILLPMTFSSACDSSPMTMGLNWLHEIELVQAEVRKGDLGVENTGGVGGYWRKDIRGLESPIVNGRPTTLLSAQVAAADIGETGTKVDRSWPELSLRSMKFADEPPIDHNRYAVVMWVQEWGRMGMWTLVLSQDGVWGKPGKHELQHFPVDLAGEGWLPKEEVKRIRSKSRRLDRWMSFWGLG